ncbi:hypothetical protein CMO92_00995 [Candidatus Woesearchaeota archaeon]|nr:hypothetical protein [Candidatus Woesearchaeota archaeon]|tara:strand:+ start:1078 stop:1467 length:390 start_codon:yes stop_codon:yes gene_type:complete
MKKTIFLRFLVGLMIVLSITTLVSAVKFNLEGEGKVWANGEGRLQVEGRGDIQFDGEGEISFLDTPRTRFYNDGFEHSFDGERHRFSGEGQLLVEGRLLEFELNGRGSIRLRGEGSASFDGVGEIMYRS